MQILITGGGGFLGSYVIQELLKRPHFILTNFSRNNYSHLEDLGVPTIKGDIRRKEDLEYVFKKGNFEAVIHLAALSSFWGYDQDVFSTNQIGTQNLIEVAKEFGISKILFVTPAHQFLSTENLLGVSEDIAYPKKFLNSYFESKAQAEQFLLSSNEGKFSTTSLRLPPLWGKGDVNFLPPLIQKARKGELKIIGDEENLTDLLFVENAALLIIKAFEKFILTSDFNGRSFFVNEGLPVNFWNVFIKMLSFYQINPPDQKISFPSAFRKARIYEKIYKWAGILKPSPPLTKYQAIHLGRSHYFSSKDFYKIIDPSSLIDFDQALKKTFGLRERFKGHEKDYP